MIVNSSNNNYLEEEEENFVLTKINTSKMTTSAPNSSTANTSNNNTSNSNNSPTSKNNHSNTSVISSSNNSSNSVIPLNTSPIEAAISTSTATSTAISTAISISTAIAIPTPSSLASSITTELGATSVTPSIALTTSPGLAAIQNSNITSGNSTMLSTPIAALASSTMSAITVNPGTPSLPSSLLLSTTPTPQSNSNTRPMQSDEDFNIRFVNLVRQHRCLYDKKVPEYRNRDNQEKAWALISHETRENVVHCKERWRNLRACLSRYIKQQSGSDPQHKPYYLTEHMAFLLPFLKSSRNSLNGNNSLAQLYQFSQQQYQYQGQQQHQQKPNNITNNNLHFLSQFGTNHNNNNSSSSNNNNNNNNTNSNYNDPKGVLQPMSYDMKHSISENDDEETIDAFDPAFTENQQNLQSNNNNNNSPALSDTASANTFNSFTHFIPDVQLSELQTSDGAPDMSYLAQQPQQQQPQQQQPQVHHQHGITTIRRNSNDYGSLHHQPIKRIKTECHASEATTTASMPLYNGENSDMEFFRSILPDIALLTNQQKRKLKIGILELIDDVIERYPADRTIVTNHINNSNNNFLNNSNNNNQNFANDNIINNNNNNNNNNNSSSSNNNNNNNGTKQRRNSNRDWRR